MKFLSTLLLTVLLLPQEPSSTVDQLIQRLRSEKAEERSRAEQALVLRGDEAVPALQGAAQDPDAEVAARARVILEKIPLLRTLTPALEKALPGTRVKLAVGSPHAWTEVFLEAVKQDGPKRAHPELGRDDFVPLARLALRAAEKSEVAAVCGAIAAWELRAAAPELVRHLDEQDWNIRQYVFDAVVSCRARELAPAILERLRREQGSMKSMWLGLLVGAGCPEAPREVAGAMQGNREGPGGGGEATFEQAADAEALDAVPAMLRHLRQAHYNAGEAIAALARIAPDELLPAIRAGLRSPEASEKLGMLQLITQTHATRSLLPDVLKLLEERDPGVRTQALGALGALRLRDQLPVIRKRLEDPALTVRRSAASILASFGDKAGLPELLIMLQQPESQLAAFWGIRLLRAREAIPDMLPLLQDPQSRVHAAEALAALGVQEARPVILQMMKDPDEKVRASGFYALTCLDGAKAIPHLLPLLDDNDFHLKHNTGPQMLQFLKAKEAVPKFREWAQSEDRSLRGSGLWYLSAIAPEEAVPVLVKTLSDPEQGMRSTAVDQLAMMKHAPSLPLIRALLRDPASYVRRSAAGALVRMGDREGIPLTVRAPLYTQGRFELNLFRKPEVCAAWKAKVLKGPAIHGSIREVLEEVARLGGITLESSPDLGWYGWTNDYEIEGRDLFSMISSLVGGTGAAVVDEGRLRILAPREGLRFWKRWWAEELLKSPRREDQDEGRAILADLDASEARLKAWTKERTERKAASPEEAAAILTATLKSIPGLESKLVHGGDEVWAKELSNLSDRMHLDEYRALTDADLEILAPRALAGSLTGPEKEKTLQIIAMRRFKSVQGQIAPFLKDPSGPVRVAAARVFLALEEAKALGRIAPMLEDPDPVVRTGIVQALGGAQRTELNPRIVALMDDAAIRAGLVTAAGDLQIKEAIPLLLQAASTPGFDGYRTRQLALQSLRLVGGPEQGRAVSDLIAAEFDGYAFMLIFGCLSTWGSREAIPSILKFLDNPPKFSDQAVPDAFRTLERLGAREAAPIILKKLDADRGAAATAAHMDLREAIPALRTQLQSVKNPAVIDAARALGEFGDRESIPALRKLLDHSDASVRTAATIGLAMMKDHDSLARILAVTRDKEGGYRDPLTPLLYLGSPEARREFLVNFRTQYHMATPVMAEVFGEELLPSLLPMLHSRNPGDRRNAMWAAGHIPGDAVLAELRTMLTDSYDDARITAAELLCRRGLREGVPLVVANTHDRYRAMNFELNAVRTPKAWKRLKDRELKGPLYGSGRDLVARIAKDAGLSFEEPPADHPDRAMWTNTFYRVQEWAHPLTLLDGLDRIRHRYWMVILEDDRLRLVPRRQALEFWTTWWQKENR